MAGLVILALVVVVGLFLVVSVLGGGTVHRRPRYLDDEDETSYQVGNKVGGDLAGRDINKTPAKPARVVTSSPAPSMPRRTGANADYVADDSASFLAAAVLMDSMNQPIPTYQQPTETPVPTPESCTPSTSESNSSCDTGSSSSHDSGSSYGGSSYDGGSYDSGGGGYDGGGGGCDSGGGGCD